MSVFHAMVLGIVQGLTEFLPISSSGHLEVIPWLLNWNDFADQATAKAFDTALHLGTLVALIVYLWKDLKRYLVHGLKVVFQPASADKKIGRQAWLVMLSAVPAGIVGQIFGDQIVEKLGGPVITALSLIFFALILLFVDRLKANKSAIESFGAGDAVLIGLAQVLALNPGTSRSGITISASRVLGYSRALAARLSFLMSVPIIGGAVIFQTTKLVRHGLPVGLLVPMTVGILSAALFGWVAMWSMIRLLQTRSFVPFVIYRIAFGGVILLVAAASIR